MIAASEKTNDIFSSLRIISIFTKTIDSEIDHYFIHRISNGQVIIEENASYHYCLYKYRRDLRYCSYENGRTLESESKME